MSIEERVSQNTHILDALYEMKEHRFWSEGTLISYINDVKIFEEFLMDNDMDPTLANGEKLHLVNKWITKQKEKNVAYKTIMRRISSLSSIYSFYKEMGIALRNAFKASKVPGRHSGSHSRVMELDDLKKVYVAIDELKRIGIDVEIPVKILMYTGLRNQWVSSLKVKNIKWDDELIIYDTSIDNYKHKVQLLPIPPTFLQRLKEYIEEMNLTEDDFLCCGIKGLPLKNKQLNLITDKINDYLGWEGEERVTPHGFRYSIATLLDENGVSIESIQYLLGHSERKNIEVYLRQHKRKIRQIKKVLTEIEEALEGSLKETAQVTQHETIDIVNESVDQSKLTPVNSFAIDDNNNHSLPYSEEFLLELSLKNPQLLEKLMMQHYLQKPK